MNRSKVLSTAVPAVLAAGALALAVVAIAHDRHKLGPALRQIGIGNTVVSALCAAVGVGAAVFIWRAILIGLGARASTPVLIRVFFPSQLGKYLPGSVWPVLAQMEFGRRVGIHRRRMLTANALMLIVSLAVGLVLAGLCLPLSSGDALHRYWWTFVFLPLLVVCLHPRIVPGVVDGIFVRLGRERLDARLSVTASLRASGWSIVNWLGMGLQVYVLARPFGAHGGDALLAAIGGMALAVSAGILFIPAPAGAGIRDAVLIATLSPSIGATHALAVALVSRASLIVIDVLLAGAAMLLPSTDAATEVRPAATGTAADQ